MTQRILVTPSLAVLSALLATPLLADVTADDVWQNWQTLGAAYGQAYTTGSETRAGDTLTITDLSMDMSSGDSKVIGTIPQVAFRETGDGRVEVTMSDAYQMTMQSKNGIGKDLSNAVSINQTGLTMLASGTPAAINYDIAADTIIVKLMDFMVDGKAKEMGVDLNLSKLAATYQIAPGERTGVTSTFAAQGLTFQAKGQNEGGQGSFDAKGQMNNIAGASAGSIPKAMAKGDLAAMLAKGFTTDGSFTYDSGNLAIVATDPKGSVLNIDSTSQGGNLNVSMDSARIAYGVNGKNVAIKATGSSIPFPELSAAYEDAAFSLLLPIAKGDAPKDFAINAKLQGLTVSDVLWGMIDPGATLPRDPATLNIALKGKAKPLVDLLGAEKMAMMGQKPPFEVSALDVEALQLTVAGAEFKGNGALAFDNTQPPVLGGVAPMPTGKLNLSLTGVNTLLGKLQALGLIDQQVPMTFGMMAGMLAKPGPTPDSFVSEVEFKEGGQILSNGNPLPF